MVDQQPPHPRDGGQPRGRSFVNLMRTEDCRRPEPVHSSPADEALIQAHYGRLRRLCDLLLRDREESEEAVQDVFMKGSLPELEQDDASSSACDGSEGLEEGRCWDAVGGIAEPALMGGGGLDDEDAPEGGEP